MSYDSHAKTWVTSTGSTVTVFAFPYGDVEKIGVGVAVNNDYKRESNFNPFSLKQSERAIDTMLKCGGTPEQVKELADFLHKELRVAEVKEEKETNLAVDSEKGLSASVKKKSEKKA
ncbi:MAG: hypothetical protein ABIE55_01270 [Candidatus Aenigmatarchaeota archaeon]